MAVERPADDWSVASLAKFPLMSTSSANTGAITAKKRGFSILERR